MSKEETRFLSVFSKQVFVNHFQSCGSAQFESFSASNHIVELKQITFFEKFEVFVGEFAHIEAAECVAHVVVLMLLAI